MKWNSHDDNIRKSVLKYIEFKILIHSIDSFPLSTTEEIYLTDDNYYYENSFILKLSRYEFERLPNLTKQIVITMETVIDFNV